MILEAVKKWFKTAFDADKNGGIEALNGIKIESPSPELYELTSQVVLSSLLLGRVQAQDGMALADDDYTVSFDETTIPFKEAVEYLKTLISIPKEEWLELERNVQFRAFTVAALAEADGIEKVRASLTKAVEEGSPIWESWLEIEALTEKLGNKFSPGYWETVYRTNAQTAYNAGRLMQYRDNMPPAWELLFIQDKRQSDTCKDLAHLVGEKAIPSDHHFWKTYGFPPYHFNCRTTFRAVYDYEMKGGEIAIVRPSKKALEENFAVQEGFGGNPLEKESWWKLTESMVKHAEKYGILEQVQAFGEKYGVDLKDFKTTVAKVRKAVAVKGGKARVQHNYGNAESIEEARKELSNFTNRTSFAKDTDVETINAVAKQLEYLNSQYPTNKLKSITFSGRMASNLGGHACYETLCINKNVKEYGLSILSPSEWKNKRQSLINERKKEKSGLKILMDILNERQKKSYIIKIKEIDKEIAFLVEEKKYKRGNVMYKGLEIETSIAHEYGHIIVDQRIGQINGKLANILFEKNVNNPLYKKVKMMDNVFDQAKAKGDIYKISMYAAKDSYEFFAEAFTMYAMKKEPLPQYIVDMIEEVIK